MPATIVNRTRSLAGPIYRFAIRALPDGPALRLQYLRRMGMLPALRKPRTFTEKVQWRKLYDRDPRLPPLVDKLGAKEAVAERLGKDWVIPTLWSGTELPARERRNWPIPYVLKASHGSGWNRFVRSPEEQDWDSIERDCRFWLSSHYLPELREWPYSEITPRLLVEPYLGSGTTAPLDYKFFVFDGRAHFVEVDTDRLTAHKRVFYDTKWRRQPFGLTFPIEPREIPPPVSLTRMIEAAETLGAGFSFVRVDLYEIDGRPRFSELTFFPGSGFIRFDPADYDRVFGELWPLPPRFAVGARARRPNGGALPRR